MSNVNMQTLLMMIAGLFPLCLSSFFLLFVTVLRLSGGRDGTMILQGKRLFTISGRAPIPVTTRVHLEACTTNLPPQP